MDQTGTDVILDAPAIVVTKAPRLAFMPDKKWGAEREAFYRMLPDLLATHRARYVAIHGGTVVGDGDDSFQVSLEAHRQFGRESPIYIGFVSDQPVAPVRIPSAPQVSR